jgi:hypothetical protein
MTEDVKKKNKLTIIFIIVMFISPLFLSWYVFNYTDFLEMRGMSNKGDLIIPPKTLDDLSLIDPLDNKRNDSLYGKWTMAYISETCDKKCMDNVYRMRQIHLAMDKHSLRVQKVLFLIDQSPNELKESLINFKGQQVVDSKGLNLDDLLSNFKLNNSDNPIDANRLYIIDPLGNLMMSFSPDANPRDIYKDLKKLLRNSRIG